MYYATDLVKFPAYRKLLMEMFPKPRLTIADFKTAPPENLSLGGNAFEVLFTLCQLKKNNLDLVFQKEFTIAASSLAAVSIRFRQKFEYRNSCVYFAAPNASYCSMLVNFKKVLEKQGHVIQQFRTPVPYFEVPKHLMLDTLLKLDILCDSPAGEWWRLNRLVIFDFDSYAQKVKNIPDNFRREVGTFYKTKKLTKSLARTIFQFTEISHPFSATRLFTSVFLSESYQVQIKRLFDNFCQNHSRLRGSVSRHPHIDILEVSARPDLLIGDKLHEIKACKKFSAPDYLQALTYLIFAQHIENQKKFGEVKAIVLHYVLANQQIEIKAKDLNLTRDIWVKIESAIRKFKRKKRSKL